MKRYLIFSIASLGLAACNGGPNKPNIELIQNMMDQTSIKSQDWDPKQGDKVQMRQPPKGTLPRGYTPYPYANDPNAAEKQVNPLAGKTADDIMALGKKKYEIYCMVCHGADGAGGTPVAEKMAVKPRNLINAEAKAYTDGRIYHAITAGRGVMGSYAGQIPDAKARWAVVNYLRSLQK